MKRSFKHLLPFRGFTILEILVSVALLILLAGITLSILSASQNVWARASAQVTQLRGVRQAFDILSRRLAQATLNPYWQVVFTNNLPQRFERMSDQRFFVGPPPGGAPGTSVFFQSPTGFSSHGTGELDRTLNTWGYFVEYGSDKNYRPDFLSTAGVPERNRFRLIEFIDPSDDLEIFRRTSGQPAYAGTEWFSVPLAKAGRKRVLAENVVAFVVLPRLSSLEDATGTALAPNFSYDSTARNANSLLNPRSQLPPVLEIAAVAIDERTASRLTWGDTPPNFGISLDGLFQNASQLDSDLKTLRDALAKKGLEARIFRQTVPIVAARWSVEQKN